MFPYLLFTSYYSLLHNDLSGSGDLSGELTVVTEDNRTVYLKAGDSIVEVVNKWHYGKNEGDKTAEILVFYAGVVDTPITIKKQGPTHDE